MKTCKECSIDGACCYYYFQHHNLVDWLALGKTQTEK